ncbi:glycosyltransferase family 4 protein [Streptomyces nodosus]|uniref:Glycosyltransferase family 1 protein n=1 Tax=Streptomyces nodosus TaxID=40318 RepID=A0A5P2WCG3_9ACTN|nr:glycosyltransferase family 4 protein [Streptomyces nodosus]MBB4794948.1 glycosyltransferase involved in cell wall biosynthesis [Streptomyces nodosus]QEV41986.1 glycosyltransferase family 1 protein [Streptomyces nodosus]
MSRRTLRALTLAVSVTWAELRHDPARAALFAGRLLPARDRHPLPPAKRRPDASPRPTGPVPAPPGRRILPVPGRVLHLVPEGLPERHTNATARTQALARAQSAAGLDPHVVTRIGFPLDHGVFDARPLHLLDGVPQHRLLPRWLPYDPTAALSRQAELTAHLVERLRPSALHVGGDVGDGLVALALRETYGLPVVHEVRRLGREGRGIGQEGRPAREPRRSRGNHNYPAISEWETHCLREADAVLTASRAMKTEILSRGVPEERVHIAPEAVDPAFLDPLPDSTALRADLGIEPGEHVVGTAGDLTRPEGIGTLLEAAAELRRRGVPVRLLLMGEGPERPALETLAARLGLTGAVVFTGRVPRDRLRAHHAVLDVFAVPRIEEHPHPAAPPLAAVEAMASGLPLLASDLPAMTELVDPGVNGLLLPPNSTPAWTDALDMLLSTPKKRQAWGTAAHATVVRDRSWERIATTTLDVYRTLGSA